jgi:peptidoglycan-associated lipoprotein
MLIKKFSQSLLTVAVLAIAFSACSKKQNADGEVAGDAAVQTTDLAGANGAPGNPIPELSKVLFAYDSFALDAAGKATLDANADWLKNNSGRKVQIEGHCDERGTTEYNLALGERRASTVKEYLLTKGVAATQLSTISYGEERPSVSGNDEAAWAQNRRGEFVSGQ